MEPDDVLINKILCTILGFKSINDKKTHIPEYKFILYNIVQQFYDILDEINVYLSITKDDINTVKKCLSVTKKLIKHKEITIMPIYKLENYEKIKYYKISIINMRKIIKNKYKPKTISFGWD